MLKIGEVAKRTGLSVRALRHDEELGLLRPASRNDGGQRIYGARELARLQQIVSLRQLGFGLSGIRAMLAGPEPDPLDVLESHLAQIEARIDAWSRLRDRLTSIARQMRAGESRSLNDLLETLEMMAMAEKYYTQEQLERLARRRDEVGEDRVKEVEAEWPRLIDEVIAAIDAGVSANDPRARALAERWMGLVREFSGGNREIEGVIQRVWEQDGERLVEQHGMNPRMMECADYINRALAAFAPE
jgi:DNA-binding transcriptional MerR regulator